MSAWREQLLFYYSVAAKIAPFDFGEEPSNSGNSASVQCLVMAGDFPIDFKWLFNGRPISELFGVSTAKLGKRIYALSIDSVSGAHAGNYTCEVYNAAGVDRHSAELVVNGIQQFEISAHFLASNRCVYFVNFEKAPRIYLCEQRCGTTALLCQQSAAQMGRF